MNKEFGDKIKNQTEFKKEEIDLPEAIYNKNEAEKIRQEKKILKENLSDRFEKCNLLIELNAVIPCLDEMFFSNLPDKDNETRHIFHHVLAGSNIGNIGIDVDYYYNEKDEEAEEFVKELLAIEDDDQFIKRCEEIIAKTKERRKDRIRKKLDDLNEV